MKKFSLFLMGAFLLGTVAFVLADETNTEEGTGATAEITTTEVATGDTAEVETGTTVEVTTGDTAEVETGTTAEVTTGDTAEVETGTTAEVTTGDTAEVETGDTADEVEATEEETVDENSIIISDSAKEKYNEEQLTAYEWAFENGVTTINDADKARLSDGLTRAELAKMMSQYMTKVLGKTPAETEKVEYADVNESLGDLAEFIQTAYAYKIMGVNADGTPLKNFNPNGKVTRAEYATVFSRVLFGDKYNKSEGNYYEDHIAALKKAGILTNDDATIKEVRGWVMLMMYRSTNIDIEAVMEEAATTEETTTADETATTEETATADETATTEETATADETATTEETITADETATTEETTTTEEATTADETTTTENN